jgi:hypothetical protein
MPKPRAPKKTELLDMGSRVLAEFEEAQRRRAAWAEQRALREQIERLIRTTGSEREEK